MTLKVSITPEHWEYLQNKENTTHDPRMFFDLNGGDYEFAIHSDQPVDILVLTYKELILGQFRSWGNYQIAIMLDLWHGEEGNISKLKRFPLRHNEYIITCINNVDHPQFICNDFMFNRTKAYYSQFPFSSGVVKWYSYGQLSYMIPEPKDVEHKKKIFVAPCKTYPENPKESRSRLRDLLQIQTDKGYLGNIDANPDLFLYPHIEFPWCSSIEEIETQTRPLSYRWWGYSPPHNEYYRNTFISIYSESISFGPDLFITEKTYDPLIKGHFILPFSNHGFVNWLGQVGIQLPSFIDYTYDFIEDDNQRLEAYLAEVDRLLNIPIEQWRIYYNNNIKLLRHNQLMFHSRDYDKVDLKGLICQTN